MPEFDLIWFDFIIETDQEGRDGFRKVTKYSWFTQSWSLASQSRKAGGLAESGQTQSEEQIRQLRCFAFLTQAGTSHYKIPLFACILLFYRTLCWPEQKRPRYQVSLEYWVRSVQMNRKRRNTKLCRKCLSTFCCVPSSPVSLHCTNFSEFL